MIRQELTTTIDLEQAMEMIETLHVEACKLKEDYLRRKFKIGEVVSRLETPYGEKEKALTRINIETGVHVNQLREWARIYSYFGGSMHEFNRWLRNETDPNESKLRDLISANSDHSVLGARKLATRMEYRFESLATDLDTYNGLVEQGIVDRMQAEGVVSAVYESMQKYRETSGFKVERVVDKTWLQKVRMLPCAITGQPGPSDPHHVMVGGIRMKGSDLSCIPLSRKIHNMAEDKGHKWLEETYGVRIGDLIAKTIHKILTGQELVLPDDV